MPSVLLPATPCSSGLFQQSACTIAATPYRCTDKHEWQSRLGVPCCWNHWQAGHGKGEHDGIGTHIEAAVRREAAWQEGVVIDSPLKFYEFCAMQLRQAAAQTSDAKAAQVQMAGRRIVWVPGPGERGAVQRTEGGQKHTGAQGQMGCHCFYTSGTEPGVVKMEEVSCMSPACRCVEGLGGAGWEERGLGRLGGLGGLACAAACPIFF